METWEQFTRGLVERMGFRDYKVEVDEEHNSASIVVYDAPPAFKEFIPSFVESMNHISQTLGQKHNRPPLFFDVNNYRKEREKLLSDLARAAARKAIATKEPITLPAMNSYERRIIHMELAGHPDVITESQGGGRERYVIVKLVEAGVPKSSGEHLMND
jgi:predicted RNA-binding protein Jag